MRDLNEQQNLAACPFCGGRADTDFIEGASYIIECSICGSHTGFEDSPADAIAAWNRRAPAASPAPVAAKIRTWQERITDANAARSFFPLHVPSVKESMMEAEIADLRAALSAAPQAQAAQQPDNVHELDAAMSLLRVARKIDASKVSPAALRKQLLESVAIAEGAEGEGDEYIFADVYEHLSSMIAPYVHGGELDAIHPFPASVVDTFTMLLEHYLAATPAAPVAPVAPSEQERIADVIQKLMGKCIIDWFAPDEEEGFGSAEHEREYLLDKIREVSAAPAAPDEG